MSDTAYYYPAPYWGMSEGDWIKSLLLFFDDVAILLPDYMHGRHTSADPVLAAPLEERGLLRVLEPKEWLDQEMIDLLGEVVIGLIADGAFDELPKKTHFHELSWSRMGYGVDVEMAQFLVDELKSRGLAKPSEDGVSVPLHPDVRTIILVILGQLSRIAGQKQGITIHPASNDFSAIQDLVQAFSMESMPSRENIIQLDLEPVTFDLASIPLDEVLQFRAEHRTAYQTYAKNLRRFMFELASVDDAKERHELLIQRRQEVADASHDIQETTRLAFRKNLSSWSLGIAGAGWAASTGDPIGLALTVLGIAPSMLSDGREEMVGAYSYVFRIGSAFGR